MKTIREWLEELPKPYVKKALENLDESEKDKKCQDAFNALHCAFDWDKTPQGFEYWADLADTLETE